PSLSAADDDCGLLVRALLGDQLLLADATVQALVCRDCGGHPAESPLSLGPLFERVVDPAAQRIGPPGLDCPVPRLDQLGVDGDGHAFLARHANHNTTSVILLYNRSVADLLVRRGLVERAEQRRAADDERDVPRRVLGGGLTVRRDDERVTRER